MRPERALGDVVYHTEIILSPRHYSLDQLASTFSRTASRSRNQCRLTHFNRNGSVKALQKSSIIVRLPRAITGVLTAAICFIA